MVYIEGVVHIMHKRKILYIKELQLFTTEIHHPSKHLRPSILQEKVLGEASAGINFERTDHFENCFA